MLSIFYILKLVGLVFSSTLSVKASVITVTLLLEFIKALILVWSSKIKSGSKYKIYAIRSPKTWFSELVITNVKVVKTIAVFWLKAFVSIVPFFITVITGDLAEVRLLSIAIFFLILCWGYICLWGKDTIFLTLNSLFLGLFFLFFSLFGLFEFFNPLLVLLSLTLVFWNRAGLLCLVRLFIAVVFY